MQRKILPEIHSKIFLSMLVIGAFCMGGIASLAAIYLGNKLGNIQKINPSPSTQVSQLQTSPTTVASPVKNIRIDLQNNTITLQYGETAERTLYILEKPTARTYFDIPSGEYSVREQRNLYTIPHKNLSLPHAVILNNTYVIHGPALGDPTMHGITLSEADSLEFATFAEHDTPVYVYNTIPAGQNTPEFTSTLSTLPFVFAKSFAITDIETGAKIVEKNASDIRPIASVTKLMTALVSLDILRQNNTVTLTQDAIDTYGNSGGFSTNQSYRVSELIYPLLLASSNDAAEAYAEHSGRPYFISLMNDKAKQLGMIHTIYADPSGLSPQNSSSALDLCLLVTHIYKYKPYILEVTHLPNYTVGTQTWKNNSEFVTKNYFVGGKSGYIPEAEKTYAGIFEVTFKTGETRLVAITLLSSTNRVYDIEALRSYIEKTISIDYK